MSECVHCKRDLINNFSCCANMFALTAERDALKALVVDTHDLIVKHEAEISRLKGELNQAIKAATDWQNKLTEQRDLWKSVAMGAKEALLACMQMRNFSRPQKLDEALTWRDNDDLAKKWADEALAAFPKEGV